MAKAASQRFGVSTKLKSGTERRRLRQGSCAMAPTALPAHFCFGHAWFLIVDVFRGDAVYAGCIAAVTPQAGDAA